MGKARGFANRKASHAGEMRWSWRTRETADFFGTRSRGHVDSQREIVLPQLPSPIRVEMNSKGEIFALDGSSRKIVRVAPTGEFLGYFAPAGDVQGTVVPRSLRIARDDSVYLLDVSAARVLVLDPSGKILREVPFPKGYGFFSDLAVDVGGNILLLDSVRRMVFKVAKNSPEAAQLGESLKEEAYFPVSITTDKQGTIFLVDQNGSGIVILGPDGSLRGRRLSMGWKDGFLRYPAQMCVTENGAAFIADRGTTGSTDSRSRNNRGTFIGYLQRILKSSPWEIRAPPRSNPKG